MLLELLETEQRYGEDLQLMMTEFHDPLNGAKSVLGGVSVTELFTNLPELLTTHKRLLRKLKEAVSVAERRGDWDLTSVDVGRVFLSCGAVMLQAFERYCSNSGRALSTLKALEKDSPVFRLFLGAARDDNPSLRRQDMRSFLILPVQRIARYPLLLQRIKQLSHDSDHPGQCSNLTEAVAQLNAMLQRINEQCPSPRQAANLPDQAAIFGAALRILSASAATARLVTFGALRISTSSSSLSASLRFQDCLALLITIDVPPESGFPRDVIPPEDVEALELPPVSPRPLTEAAIERLHFPRHSAKLQHFLLLFHPQRPSSAPSLMREPFCLGDCVLSRVLHHPTAFQLHLMRGDSVMLSGPKLTDSDRWFGLMKQLVLSSGQWRLRRHAMPHVMLTQRRGSLLSTAF